MQRIRILLVDDSAVVRRLVTSALALDPALEVVGTASNGRIGLQRIEELNPDLVLLDLEMPDMDGLETLAALRRTHPRLPVIMFSRFTRKGVEATVHALTLGADDYVPKPGDGVDTDVCIRDVLIPKIKELGRRAPPTAPPTLVPAPPPAPRPLPRRVQVVAIGASTGGPNALVEILPALPRTCRVPVLIAQHMPAEFTARLAERLAERSGLRVLEGLADQTLDQAQVWVAPGDQHMVVRSEGAVTRLVLNRDARVNSCRPSVDVLFQSVAEVFGPAALAVVLTGLGQDGLRGCEQIHRAGGQVLVQDEASSVVWSMPGAVAKAGLADAVLPLDCIGPEIARRVAHHAPRDS